MYPLKAVLNQIHPTNQCHSPLKMMLSVNLHLDTDIKINEHFGFV
jgi:hypothetical protein